MTRSRLIIIHGAKGGVGKTTLARLLLERCRLLGLAACVYDVDGDLVRAYREVRKIDFRDFASVAPIIDGLIRAPGSLALVDLGARMQGELIEWLITSGGLDAASRGILEISVLFCLGLGVDGVALLTALGEALEPVPVSLVAVRNVGVSRVFAFDDQLDGNRAIVTIPALDPMVMRQIDAALKPYRDFIADEGQGYSARFAADAWFCAAHKELAAIAPLLQPMGQDGDGYFSGAIPPAGEAEPVPADPGVVAADAGRVADEPAPRVAGKLAEPLWTAPIIPEPPPKPDPSSPNWAAPALERPLAGEAGRGA